MVNKTAKRAATSDLFFFTHAFLSRALKAIRSCARWSCVCVCLLLFVLFSSFFRSLIVWVFFVFRRRSFSLCKECYLKMFWLQFAFRLPFGRCCCTLLLAPVYVSVSCACASISVIRVYLYVVLFFLSSFAAISLSPNLSLGTRQPEST